MAAIPTVAAAVLLALLVLRTALLVWRFERERQATAREVERRRALGLTPIQARLEVDHDPVVLGTFGDDDGLRCDPVLLTAREVHLRGTSGERFVVPAGTPLLAFGIPSAMQRRAPRDGPELRTELVMPRATPLWLLAPKTDGAPAPYRPSAPPQSLLTDVELSEQRACLELAPAPRHRPRWAAWGGLLVLLAAPSWPGLSPVVTVAGGTLLIGLAVIALMTCAFVLPEEVSEPFGRLFLSPGAPWPVRHELSPRTRGVLPVSAPSAPS